MGSKFSQADWDFVTQTALAISRQLLAKGATVQPFRPFPPIPSEQIEEFTSVTGLVLPQDLTEFLTEFSGGWTFYWSLFSTAKDEFIQPPVTMGNFGGNSEVAFIGAAEGDSLLRRYQEFQAEIHDTYVDDPATLEALPAMIPLHAWDGGGGDYTVLRIDKSPAEVLYLDHETAWEIGQAGVLGTGFREFVLRWAEAGFLQMQYHLGWLNSHAQDEARATADDARLRAWLVGE